MPKAEVRAQKEQTVNELADKLSRSQLVIVTDYRGLTVAEMSALRGRLRQAGAEYQVTKNTLTRFAARAGRPGQPRGRPDRAVGDRVRVRGPGRARQVAPGVPASGPDQPTGRQGRGPRRPPRHG